MGIKKDGKLIDNCLEKLHEGESFFVLRAQDFSSPLMILEWLRLNHHLLGTPKAQEAIECINTMTKWARDGKSKLAN